MATDGDDALMRMATDDEDDALMRMTADECRDECR
jgi:hypothetical protein